MTSSSSLTRLVRLNANGRANGFSRRPEIRRILGSHLDWSVL